jgi:uncharacterized phage infection (PIP) family protein YhgE
LITIIFTIIFGVCFYYGLRFAIEKTNKNTTSEASSEIPKVIGLIESTDKTIQEILAYASELLPFDEAIERQEKEQLLKEELNKQLSILAKTEGQLNELKLEVDETEQEYNEIKKGKESAQEVADNIKNRKNSLKEESESLQNGLADVTSSIREFATKTKLNANQEAGFKLILGNIEAANKQLETLITSYNQSSSRFLNLHEQFNDLEVEFSKLVEKELSD